MSGKPEPEPKIPKEKEALQEELKAQDDDSVTITKVNEPIKKQPAAPDSETIDKSTAGGNSIAPTENASPATEKKVVSQTVDNAKDKDKLDLD